MHHEGRNVDTEQTTLRFCKLLNYLTLCLCLSSVIIILDYLKVFVTMAATPWISGVTGTMILLGLTIAVIGFIYRAWMEISPQRWRPAIFLFGASFAICIVVFFATELEERANSVLIRNAEGCYIVHGAEAAKEVGKYYFDKRTRITGSDEQVLRVEKSDRIYCENTVTIQMAPRSILGPESILPLFYERKAK